LSGSKATTSSTPKPRTLAPAESFSTSTVPFLRAPSFEVTLTFPPHVTLTDAVRVRFTARVIRVEHPLPSARIGTAAMIEDYEFLRSNGSPDFLAALQSDGKQSN
jgi:hypothetical protein